MSNGYGVWDTACKQWHRVACVDWPMVPWVSRSEAEAKNKADEMNVGNGCFFEARPFNWDDEVPQ